MVARRAESGGSHGPSTADDLYVPRQVAHDSKVCRAGNSNGSKCAYSGEFSLEIQKFGKDIIENAPRSSKNKRISYITVNRGVQQSSRF